MRLLSTLAQLAVLFSVLAEAKHEHLHHHHQQKRGDWSLSSTSIPTSTSTSSSSTTTGWGTWSADPKSTSTSSSITTSWTETGWVSWSVVGKTSSTSSSSKSTVTAWSSSVADSWAFPWGDPQACMADPAWSVAADGTTVYNSVKGAATGSAKSVATGSTKGAGYGSSVAASSAVTSLSPSLASALFKPSSFSYAPLGTSQVSSGNALSQSSTNGDSWLGTFNAPTYPPWIGANTTGASGFPWGSRTANGTNPYTQPPNTGVTRFYDFVIKRGTIAPDGVQRSVLLVNNQFPGPTIEANWGDTVQVTVHNEITGPEEGTSLHWHGLLQTGTPWMDGVPGIAQCPIAPGTTFSYVFNADLYGTTWYHSHYSAQYAGGLIGPLIIHGPKNVDYDIDLGPVLLTDYYHEDYFTIVEGIMGTDLSKIAPFSVNNLINGKGNFNCSLITDGTPCTPNAGLSKFKFTAGKTHRLRLINAGAEGIQKFSIDNHILTVIANDFVPVVPYDTTIVTLGIGQRTDVLVTANGSVSDVVWMRSTLSTCSLASQPDGLAIIYYNGAVNATAKPNTTAWPDTTDPCANDALTETVPFFPITPTSTPATTIEMDIGILINATGHFLWTVNNSTFRVDYNAPLLDLVHQGNDSYPLDREWNVYDLGTNSSVRLVVVNETPVTHPMHLHGHNMHVLAVGPGTVWDGTVTHPANPQRRDVQLLPGGDFLVIQFDLDNPGVWPFHCHIAWHVSGGLYVNLMEQPAKVAQMDIPAAATTGLCDSWAAYTNKDVVDQIDSGL